MSGRVVFTVIVLAVFVAAIVYTAVWARAAVDAEAEAVNVAAEGTHVDHAAHGLVPAARPNDDDLAFDAAISRLLDDAEQSAA